MARHRVRNADRLRRKFIAMPRIARRQIETGISESAEDMVVTMGRRAPKKSGKLRASVKWKFVVAKGLRITARISAGGRGTGQPYWAPFQEFGTQKHPAQPFFFPTYRQKRRAARRRIARAVRQAGRLAAAIS